MTISGYPHTGRMTLEKKADWRGYGIACVVTALATGLSALIAPQIHLTNLVMVYLLGVAYVASRTTPRAAILASVLGVAAFDFCFVPPNGTFTVDDVEYVFTFAVMLVVSILISTLTVRLREQSERSQRTAIEAQLEKTRGDLLSAVSHDLRTPLASIEGSADALLQQPELTPQSRQLAGTIQDESVRMSNLIRNLLDMTRVSGKIDLDLDWYGLDELLANAMLRTEVLFVNPVKMHVAPGTPLVRVDGVLLEQVFVNLLENAARYAGRNAQVEINVTAAKDQACIEFADNGPGIPPGSEEKVFARFHGAGGGFGLGLAICRAAVEAHHGHISATNRPTGGACFLLKLPIGGQP